MSEPNVNISDFTVHSRTFARTDPKKREREKERDTNGSEWKRIRIVLKKSDFRHENTT